MGKDTWKAMIQLLSAGKAKAIGVSNYDILQVKEILQNFDVLPSDLLSISFVKARNFSVSGPLK
jgi:aryl-alcohol dehydrogenase-like predicted oxidoreductase